MSGIVGLEDISDAEFNHELQNGAKFVVYSWCISVIILSFKQPSAIYFVRSHESRFAKGLPYTCLSLLLGWWGFPFGLIYTPWCVISNCADGMDVTNEILGAMSQPQRGYD